MLKENLLESYTDEEPSLLTRLPTHPHTHTHTHNTHTVRVPVYKVQWSVLIREKWKQECVLRSDSTNK